ncbi:MAG: prepilin-type N-terminal cleavage/methylation domain-containing protein [Candidatus Methylomirabilales bacterium]
MRGQQGLTLLEVILVLVLILLLVGILAPALRKAAQSFGSVETRAGLTVQARGAVHRIVREVRNTQKKPNNAPNITTADTATITFVDVLDNIVTFSLAGSTVQRGGDVLADNVAGLQFRYFDGSNAELTPLPLNAVNRDNVRRILVILTLQDRGQTTTLSGQVFLRDLTGL